MFEEIPIYTPFATAGLGAALGGALSLVRYAEPSALDLIRGVAVGGGIGATAGLVGLAADYILTKLLKRRPTEATPFIYGVPMALGSVAAYRRI